MIMYEIEEIEEIIESKNLHEAVFECDLYTHPTDTYFSEVEKLPGWIQKGIETMQIEVVENWDCNFWESDPVQISLSVDEHAESELNDRLEEWKDECEKEYGSFCNIVAEAIISHIKQQENFQVFDSIMRGENATI